DNFNQVRDLVFASAAFPIAFPAQKLGYCMTRPRASTGTASCARPERSDDFIDGGVFDNNPLGLAVRLAQLGLRPAPGGGLAWRDLDDGGARALPASDTASAPPPGAVHYVYLDPDSTAYPTVSQPLVRGQSLPVVPTVTRLAGAFVNSSRSKELYAIAQGNPDLSTQMELTKRHFPTASGQLFNFLGFFEREFRRYDFYLGMYDAYRFFESEAPRRGIPVEPPFPAHAKPRELAPSWRPFACLLSV